ncbi:hypothetical protein BT69DRAFT_376708 [Atractiella rhizophila]|nr:hypothetical protein BT69DRAFT_376708 [Atractiella rhizophila]
MEMPWTRHESLTSHFACSADGDSKGSGGVPTRETVILLSSALPSLFQPLSSLKV